MAERTEESGFSASHPMAHCSPSLEISVTSELKDKITELMLTGCTMKAQHQQDI